MQNTDQIDVGPRWQTKFALLEKLCGGTQFNAMLIINTLRPQNGGEKLSFGEKFNFVCWPAFFFGCLWYLYKGMWKKAIVLFGISLVLGLLVDLMTSKNSSGSGALGISLVYSYMVGKMATADHYRQVKQGFDGWF